MADIGGRMLMEFMKSWLIAKTSAPDLQKFFVVCCTQDFVLNKSCAELIRRYGRDVLSRRDVSSRRELDTAMANGRELKKQDAL
ncbi:hypothetical protein ACU8KH_05011 [Lachancea thermotolerans]